MYTLKTIENIYKLNYPVDQVKSDLSCLVLRFLKQPYHMYNHITLCGIVASLLGETVENCSSFKKAKLR